MGSCSTDVVTTGDVEDQREDPKWFVDHRRILCRNEEGEGNNLGFFILKVPDCDREPIEAFSPKGWRFGLHNRENLDSSGSEAIKLGVAIQYGLVEEKWDHFCDAIVEDPKAMLACYGLENGVTNWTDKQIKHVLALDALFLAFFMDLMFPFNEKQLWTHNIVPSLFNAINVFFTRWDIWKHSVHIDLGQVENQIPLLLIDKVVFYIHSFIASPTTQGIRFDTLIVDLQYQQKSVEYAVKNVSSIFMSTSSEAFGIDNLGLPSDRTHILGVAYQIICGAKGFPMNESASRNEYIHIPSATKLKQSGIKIVGIDGPLTTMFYEKKCLHLPKMRIYDSTISFIRNLKWYEINSTDNGCLFHDYILLMIDLIQGLEDLNLLIKHGVIDNACGIKALEMWTSLNEGGVEISSSEIHHAMKVAIVSRCKHRRYRLWSEFKIVFCSRPWVVLSTIAVVLVTMATLVQTYIAIIGSNKMKPKFP